MTDTMLFGILKMPFQMAMSDEMPRTQYYARVQELVGRFEAQQQAEPVADGDKVICPACCHQFRGIPETVQTLMLHAGFEPPFTTPPQQQAEPVQEPVARVIDNGTREGATEWIPFTNRVEPLETGDLLYTAPPQRPWVGLTVTTILDMMPSAIPAEYDGELMQFARDLEAKLKERNGY